MDNINIVNDIKSEDEEQDNLIVCPCCGKKTLPKPVRPKQDIVDQWLACIVSGVSFSHTYSMYNGRIKLTVTAIDDKIRSMLNDLRVWIRRASDKLWPDTEQRPFNSDEMLARCQVLSCIKRIEVKADDAIKDFLPSSVIASVYNSLKPIAGPSIFGDENIDELRDTLIDCNKRIFDPNNISAVPADLMASSVYTHATITRYMLDMGTDSDFWGGIELA